MDSLLLRINNRPDRGLASLFVDDVLILDRGYTEMEELIDIAKNGQTDYTWNGSYKNLAASNYHSALTWEDMSYQMTKQSHRE